MSALTAELAIIDISRAQRLRLDARRAIDNAIAVYDNPDAYAEKIAMAAYTQERPAYWTTTGFSSQKAGQLQINAHQMPLNRALRAAYGVGADWIAALDTLVPLNDQAAIALTAEYAEFGSWVEVEEVLARRLRRMPATRVTL